MPVMLVSISGLIKTHWKRQESLSFLMKKLERINGCKAHECLVSIGSYLMEELLDATKSNAVGAKLFYPINETQNETISSGIHRRLK